MTVLIFGWPDDPEVNRVAARLRGRDASVVICNTAAFPEKTRIELEEGNLRFGGRRIPVPAAVYVRGLACHPLTPGFEEELRNRPRGLIAQCDETRAMLESVLRALEVCGARVVNTLEANAQHSRKPFQISLLQRHRIPVPRWLASNDPQSVRRFVRKVGRAVYKPLAGGAAVQPVTPQDLSDERLAALHTAPVLFQERLEGVAVRCYVVERRMVAAAEIRSDSLDYRCGESGVVPTRLSADERQAAVAAARACRMVFAGVDLIRRRQGFKVLECNPSPMFATFENKTELDVTGPLADLLLR